jgi:hypothetical protein
MAVKEKIRNKRMAHSVKVKIQEKMWKAQWLSRQRFKTGYTGVDGCKGKNSSQDVKDLIVDSVKENIQDKM